MVVLLRMFQQNIAYPPLAENTELGTRPGTSVGDIDCVASHHHGKVRMHYNHRSAFGSAASGPLPRVGLESPARPTTAVGSRRCRPLHTGIAPHRQPHQRRLYSPEEATRRRVSRTAVRMLMQASTTTFAAGY